MVMIFPILFLLRCLCLACLVILKDGALRAYMNALQIQQARQKTVNSRDVGSICNLGSTTINADFGIMKVHPHPRSCWKVRGALPPQMKMLAAVVPNSNGIAQFCKKLLNRNSKFEFISLYAEKCL